jgi:hypothetical protein
VWKALEEKIIEDLNCEQVNLLSTDPCVSMPLKPISSSSIFAGLEEEEEDSITQANTSLNDSVSLEIERYQQLPKLDPSCDPLEWWASHSQFFPHLSKIAKSLLSIPATSAASERVFSDGGRVVTDLRNRLKPENVADLVLLKGSWSSLDEIKKSSKKRQCSS